MTIGIHHHKRMSWRLSQLRCKTAAGIEKFRKYFLNASLTGNIFSIVTSRRSKVPNSSNFLISRRRSTTT